MAQRPTTKHVLRFGRAAWEACFLVADILADCRDEPFIEYALLGLAARDDPLHVRAVLLLPNQEVTGASVRSRGRDVLRLRPEIDALSKRMKKTLVPICFIHRHPGSCYPSGIDREFAEEVFVNQVAAAVIFTDKRRATTSPLAPDASTGAKEHGPVEENWQTLDYGLGFSLIINRGREHWIGAVRREWCPLCGSSKSCWRSARIEVTPKRRPTRAELKALRKRLEAEIAEKIILPARSTTLELPS